MCILAYCDLKPQTVVGRDQYDRSSHEMMKQSYNACTLLQPGKSWTAKMIPWEKGLRLRCSNVSMCFFWWGGVV